MAGSLFDTAEALALDLIQGGTQTVTTPLKLALVTVAGSESAAGTEVVGGSYARQTIAMTAAATSTGTTTSSNSAVITFPNMPTCTVVGFEIWDSSGTPKKLWYDYGITSRPYTLGDAATVAVGAIVTSMG